jgi:hypothetical protein
MSHEQPLPEEEESHPACHLCGQLKELISEEVCATCVEDTLLKQLPQLKRTLEDHYGAMLDRWLAAGRLENAKWSVETNFQLSPERLKSFIREIVREAVAQGEIELQLESGECWKPIQIYQLMDTLFEQCGEQAGQLTHWLTEAISHAPTEEAERELIELAWGKKRVAKRHLRDEAITALLAPGATPLPLEVRALMEMRYRVGGGRESFTQIQEGEINSVWNEVRELLPEEVAKLICKDGSF